MAHAALASFDQVWLMEYDVDYEFVLTPPDQALVAHMNVISRGRGAAPRMFDATLALERQPWTAGAIRSALDKLISRKNGFVMGQDVGRLGGVMTATAGLKAKHPNGIVDSACHTRL